MADARELPADMRLAVKDGVDPRSLRKGKHNPMAMTFKAHAERYIGERTDAHNAGKHKHRSAKHLAQWETTLARDVPGHIFVDWSAQNFDRTVSLLRAARRTERDLVLDMYAADALLQIANGTRLPCPAHPDFPELKVVITPGMKRL